MRIALAIVCCLVFALGANAQTVLGRQVVGTAAINTPTFSSTVGEPAYRSASGEAVNLKSGFEQNDENRSLELFPEVTFPECFDGNNGVLTLTAAGCGNVVSILLQTEDGVETAIDAVAPGFYTVTVATDEGCESSLLFQVASPALAPCDLEVYSLVTPNGDGSNDVWFIGNIDAPEYRDNTVKVFNRWGQLVWDATQYDNTNVVFAGAGNNGQSLPEGTYYYEIHLSGRSFTGYLTLLQ